MGGLDVVERIMRILREREKISNFSKVFRSYNYK